MGTERQRMQKFMVTLNFPRFITEEFLRKIPDQRQKIVELLASGHVASFSLNQSRSNAWLVFNAKTQDEVEALLEDFPMYDDFTYEIEHLIVHDTELMGLPRVALN
jgi:muconolactone delta-isomerase